MSTPQFSRALVQQLDVFSALPDDVLDAILQQATPMRLKEGSMLFKQGDAATHFYVLLQGHLKIVQISPDGEQVIVRHVRPGDIFGIARAMQRSHFPATNIAVQESLVLAWPSDYWDELVRQSPAFAANAFQTVGQRLQDAHTRIRELSTEEVEQRVARALLRMAEQSGTPTDEGIEISFPVTRQDIAELTGTTLHTVSRLLSNWKNRGIVTSGRRRITVCDMNALQRLTETPAP